MIGLGMVSLNPPCFQTPTSFKSVFRVRNASSLSTSAVSEPKLRLADGINRGYCVRFNFTMKYNNRFFHFNQNPVMVERFHDISLYYWIPKARIHTYQVHLFLIVPALSNLLTLWRYHSATTSNTCWSDFTWFPAVPSIWRHRLSSRVSSHRVRGRFEGTSLLDEWILVKYWSASGFKLGDRSVILMAPSPQRSWHRQLHAGRSPPVVLKPEALCRSGGDSSDIDRQWGSC